ncbi:MAG: prolyl oligopeptidase family serine peptidase [Desulfuromonas sp.]|nr:prolyl oligopeptidase family serine peptidase [Desulfuromonas sp.]
MLESPSCAPGFWSSQWSAEHAAAAGRDLNELKVSARSVFWSESDPQTALTRVYRFDRATQTVQLFTPAGFSVRSRVYEYGGSSFCLTEDGLVFVNEADQQLYLQTWQGAPQQLTQRNDCRYADMQFDPLTQSIIVLEEEHAEHAVVHRIVTVSLSGAAGQACIAPVVLVQGSDFYASPRLSPNGQRLVWVEWQRPDQPWTQTQLCYAQRMQSGEWSEAVCLAGAEGGAAVQQPLFDQHNRITALSDQQGYWQLWRENHDGQFKQLQGIEADYAGAPWQLGGCNYLALNDDEYLISWLYNGFGHLAVYSFTEQRIIKRLAQSYSRLRHLAMDNDFFYCIASHVAQGTAVLAIDRKTAQVQVLTQLAIALGFDDISQPSSCCFPSANNEPVHAFFYPPCNQRCVLAESQRPPLVVLLHGGPTSACYPVFDSRIQFWTQRGFAVADLNYRGSTGFGRQYRQRLRHQWGIVEVEDVCALVQHLIQNDWVNPKQVCVRGASAGGYTALLCVAASQQFAAAASLYGVSDPWALRRMTHKFEGDYLDWLLGAPDEFAARAPLKHVAQIATPVIFFQGGRDVVVVPEQTAVMVAALEARGIKVECHVFADEGHGFRQAENLAQVLRLELDFYQKAFQSA